MRDLFIVYQAEKQYHYTNTFRNDLTFNARLLEGKYNTEEEKDLARRWFVDYFYQHGDFEIDPKYINYYSDLDGAYQRCSIPSYVTIYPSNNIVKVESTYIMHITVSNATFHELDNNETTIDEIFMDDTYKYVSIYPFDKEVL